MTRGLLLNSFLNFSLSLSLILSFSLISSQKKIFSQCFCNVCTIICFTFLNVFMNEACWPYDVCCYPWLASCHSPFALMKSKKSDTASYTYYSSWRLFLCHRNLIQITYTSHCEPKMFCEYESRSKVNIQNKTPYLCHPQPYLVKRQVWFVLNISKHIPLFNEFKNCVKFFFCFLFFLSCFFPTQVVHFHDQFSAIFPRFTHRYFVRMDLAQRSYV